MLRRASPPLGRVPLPCTRTRAFNSRFRRVFDRPLKQFNLSSSGDEDNAGFVELCVAPRAIRGKKDFVHGTKTYSDSDRESSPDPSLASPVWSERKPREEPNGAGEASDAEPGDPSEPAGDGRPGGAIARALQEYELLPLLPQLRDMVRSPAFVFRVAIRMFLACGVLSKEDFVAMLHIYGDPDPFLARTDHILPKLILSQYYYTYTDDVMRDLVRSPWHRSILERNYDFLGVPAVLVPLPGGAGADSDPDAVRDFVCYGGPMGWDEVRSPDGAGVKYRSRAFDRLVKSKHFRSKYLCKIASKADLEWPCEGGTIRGSKDSGQVLLMTRGVASFILRMLYVKSRKQMGDETCWIMINQVDKKFDQLQYTQDQIPWRLALDDPARYLASDAIRIVEPEEFFAQADVN